MEEEEESIQEFIDNEWTIPVSVSFTVFRDVSSYEDLVGRIESVHSFEITAFTCEIHETNFLHLIPDLPITIIVQDTHSLFRAYLLSRKYTLSSKVINQREECELPIDLLILSANVVKKTRRINRAASILHHWLLHSYYRPPEGPGYLKAIQ